MLLVNRSDEHSVVDVPIELVEIALGLGNQLQAFLLMNASGSRSEAPSTRLR
jgi:hypothetical protein